MLLEIPDVLQRPCACVRSLGSSSSKGGCWYRSYDLEQLLSRNVERLRGGLVFKAHGLLYTSTLGLRVITKKKKIGFRILGLVGDRRVEQAANKLDARKRRGRNRPHLHMCVCVSELVCVCERERERE